ncbi:MAG: hypothetical protein M1820_008506 [Bogoriella megaspora]|nr:MAG: hypothetical protein M1820_008506 [Bogoriella megaspora]
MASAPPDAPIDPSLAGAAQIPLQTFQLPEFPPQAQNLKALTLTSDIALNDYNSLLTDPSFTAATAIPPLPTGIESLTLELFSLGYPAGWLEQLSKRLPNIKDLVVYSQLLGGITAESQADAERFFENSRGLRGLHLLDVFAKPGFVSSIGDILWGERDTEQQADTLGVRKRLLFLEVNYTFQPRQEDFLDRLPARELHRLVTPSLVTCAFNVSSPDVTNDPQDPTNLTKEGNEVEKKEEGIQTLKLELNEKLIEVLTKDDSRPRGLKVLNTMLYTLTIPQLLEVVKKHTGLLILSFTIKGNDTVELSKAGLIEVFEQCPDLEQVEIVGVPGKEAQEIVDNLKSGDKLDYSMFPFMKHDFEAINKKCPKLSSFKSSVLKRESIGYAEWTRGEDGVWKGGIVG